jgi:hypothetical protein
MQGILDKLVAPSSSFDAAAAAAESRKTKES